MSEVENGGLPAENQSSPHKRNQLSRIPHSAVRVTTRPRLLKPRKRSWYLGILTWREFLNFPCILHSMPHPTPRNHIRLKHSVGTRLQRAFRKTMLPPCTGRGAEVLLPDRGLLVLGDANLPRPCTCLLYTSPSPRDGLLSRMPSSA